MYPFLDRYFVIHRLLLILLSQHHELQVPFKWHDKWKKRFKLLFVDRGWIYLLNKYSSVVGHLWDISYTFFLSCSDNWYKADSPTVYTFQNTIHTNDFTLFSHSWGQITTNQTIQLWIYIYSFQVVRGVYVWGITRVLSYMVIEAWD